MPTMGRPAGPALSLLHAMPSPCERYDIPTTEHDWRGVDDAGVRRAIRELRAWFDRDRAGGHETDTRTNCTREGRNVDRYVSAKQELRARGLA